MGISAALKYALTCSTFCLVCIGGKSSVNFMVSVGVSLLYDSLPCSALCPAFADLSVPLL